MSGKIKRWLITKASRRNLSYAEQKALQRRLPWVLIGVSLVLLALVHFMGVLGLIMFAAALLLLWAYAFSKYWH